MEAKKRIFLGLVSLTIVLSGLLLLYLGQLLLTDGDSVIHELIVLLAASAVILITFMFTLGLLGIVFTIIKSQNIPLLDKWISLTLNLFYPVVMMLGRLFKIARDKIQESFVEVNNQLVKIKVQELSGKIPGEEILVLLPHCLQSSGCTHRITINIENCQRCGICPINDLLDLADQYNVPVRVATGGTLARKFVKELKPKVIVAVACERDLTSGILDTNPLPVLGIVNQRPHGPCMDTHVDLKSVEMALNYLIKGGDETCGFSIQGSYYS